MSLAQGRQYLALPGPSVMPDRVLQAMHRPAPDIYGDEIFDMLTGMIPDLKAVARTQHNVAIYICNGHGVWEGALANVLSRGDKVLTLATGRFGHGWGDMAAAMGIEVETLDFGNQAPVDPERLATVLRSDRTHKIRAVLVCHVDTATTVRSDIAAIREVLDTLGHPALLMVDCIASLAVDRFEMDAWGADVMIAASQKGLMTPPGLGFVFYNDRADAARSRADCATAYWDWRARTESEEFYQFFCGTAPTHHLFGLRVALDMLLHDEGIEAVWARHKTLACAVWAAFETWAQAGALSLNIAEPRHRTHAVTAARVGLPGGPALRDWVQRSGGLTLGVGLGMSEDGDPKGAGYFRLGHMGHVNAHMVLGALGVIEAGLRACHIPHGAGGVAAAAAICAGDPRSDLGASATP